MKKEMPPAAIIGILVALLALLLLIWFRPFGAPSTPEEAGAGLPAKPGGGVVEGGSSDSRPNGDTN